MGYGLAMADKKTEQICIRVESEVYKKLKEYANIERRSVGFLVRDMIDECLEKRRAPELSPLLKKRKGGM